MSGDHNTNQDYDKRIEKAAEHLGSGALKMIKAILMKHDVAIIEAGQEAIEAAVKAEREACAQLCGDMVFYTGYDCAAAIRARGSA